MADTIRYMEDALDAVKDYINDELDAMLATIESERDEAVPRIGHLVVGESVVQKWPRMEVLPGETVTDYGFDDAPLVNPWLRHQINLMISHTSGKTKEVEHALLRYVEGIHRITYDDSTYDGEFIWVQLLGEDYTPMMEDQEAKKMIQGVVVRLECKTR